VLAIERDPDMQAVIHLVSDLSKPHALFLDRDPARLLVQQRAVPLLRCHSSRKIEVSRATDRAGPAAWCGDALFVVV
jgi:hypothetical protein